jgi:CheY-like chemotaxis protein
MKRKLNKILIIENEPATRRILSDKLKLENFLTSESSNGLDGLEKALTEHPDLIILDLFMPKMNGLEVLKNLHADNWGKLVPIIILTNQNDDHHILEAIKDKNCEYLLKTNHNLASIIKKIKLKLK